MILLIIHLNYFWPQVALGSSTASSPNSLKKNRNYGPLSYFGQGTAMITLVLADNHRLVREGFVPS